MRRFTKIEWRTYWLVAWHRGRTCPVLRSTYSYRLANQANSAFHPFGLGAINEQA